MGNAAFESWIKSNSQDALDAIELRAAVAANPNLLPPELRGQQMSGAEYAKFQGVAALSASGNVEAAARVGNDAYNQYKLEETRQINANKAYDQALADAAALAATKKPVPSVTAQAAADVIAKGDKKMGLWDSLGSIAGSVLSSGIIPGTGAVSLAGKSISALSGLIGGAPVAGSPVSALTTQSSAPRRKSTKRRKTTSRRRPRNVIRYRRVDRRQNKQIAKLKRQVARLR